MLDFWISPRVVSQSFKINKRKKKTTIPFTLALPRMKYLGINLIKYTQDPYEENYTTLMNKTNEKLNKWRNSSCSHAKSLQLCLTLCNPMDHSLSESSVHGISWARVLE